MADAERNSCNVRACASPPGTNAPAALFAGVLMLLGACRQGDAPAVGEPSAAIDGRLIAANNDGVGLMGRFDYAAAERVFRELVAQAPSWTAARVNLAIATLNRQQPGDEEAALAMLQEVIAGESGNLRAHYMAGLLQFNQGRSAEALEHFLSVCRGDPEDAYAHYYVGQTVLQQGDPAAALPYFEKAVALDPYLRSAYYGAFLAQQRSGDGQQARHFLNEYQKLEVNPRSRLAEIKYTRMGPKAEALAVRAEPPADGPAGEPPPGGLFGPPVSLGGGVSGAFSAAPLIGGERRWMLIAERDGSRWCDLDRSCAAGDGPPFGGQTDVLAASWGDLDNDGRVDLYLARSGVNQFWRQGEDGVWTEAGATRGIGGGDLETVSALLLDADHDGDLDIFLVNADGPNELLNNNGDGSFRPLAAELGLQGTGVAAGVLAVDLDADRDTDLVVLNRQPPHEVYLNDRLWAYHPGAGFESFIEAPLVAAAAADVDADGRVELFGLDRAGAVTQWDADAAGWQPRRKIGGGMAQPAALWPADFDGDGGYEMLIAGRDRWQVKRIAAAGAALATGDGRVIALANLWTERGPGLVIAGAAGLELLPPGAGRFAFLGMRFSGREDPGQSMRSNVSGIGTDYVLRSGSLWFAGSTLPGSTAAGQALQPQLAGLGGRTQVDYLAIEWSDGVFQSELGLRAGEMHSLVETQRQLASCPVVFAWDGQRFRFVGDVLGVAGIGFNLGRGEYSRPRPWENFLLPAGLPALRDGYLEIKITEPMEEIAYLDRARLVAYDFPESLQLAVDERLAINGPPPRGDVVAFEQEIGVRKATDGNGTNVTDAIARADLRAAPIPAVDRRFVGLLEGQQTLILEFDRDLDTLASPALLMDGWIEYGYSQTSFAAWQAGRRFESATLEVEVDGRWQVLVSEFGYPAGMPRQALLRLGDLPTASRRLRLRSNQQIYWDRLALVDLVAAPPLVAGEARLHTARLESIGFPRRRNGPQLQPDYDYQDRQPFWDTRYPRGFYTALGPATELLAAKDNALAIVGPGDALSLLFEPLPPAAAGRQRRWLLMLDGWAKDMDLFTRDGATVEPLPVQPVEADHAAALHRRFNTRFQSGS